MASTDNAKYVERGRMLAMHQDPGWEQELKSANCRKNGAPFLYAESLFVSIAIIRSMAQIPYRQLRGMVSEMMPSVPIPDTPPCSGEFVISASRPWAAWLPLLQGTAPGMCSMQSIQQASRWPTGGSG